MNSKNNNASEPCRFRFCLTDKFEKSYKNMVLANFSVFCSWKNINQNTTTINLKLMFQLGMVV